VEDIEVVVGRGFLQADLLVGQAVTDHQVPTPLVARLVPTHLVGHQVDAHQVGDHLSVDQAQVQV